MEVKRRKQSKDYSRKGCTLCKSAHVKCDEKSPKCSRCLRRNTACEYVTQFLAESPAEKTKNREFKVQVNSQSSQSIECKNGLDAGIGTYEPLERFEIKPAVCTQKTLDRNIQRLSPQKGMDAITPLPQQAALNALTPTIVHSPFIPQLMETPTMPHRFHRSSFPGSVSDQSDVSQFSFSNISLSDLISVQKNDLKSLRALNKEYETMIYLYNDEKHPDLHVFEIPWDGGPMTYFLDTIHAHDPLLKLHGVSLNDQTMVDFVWTMARITKFFYTFVLYSETSLMKVLDICFKLGTKSSIFQSIITYHCSLHVVRIYRQANALDASELWDKQVRIPAFKQCIDFLREGLENTHTFADIITLTFAVLIIFSGNASDKSWRAHLNGSYQLVCKCISLRSKADINDVYDAAALRLYDIIIEWYDHTSHLATVTSLNGFSNKNIRPVLAANDRKTDMQHNEDANTNLALAENGMNLMSGHCLQISQIIAQISEFIEKLQTERGINLSGLNFVRFIISNDADTTELVEEIKSFGENVLKNIENTMDEYRYQRLELEDFRMDLSMRYCNMLYFHGLKLYITYFFMGRRERKQVINALRDILDLIYSMPYRSSCAIICNWNIYVAGIVALLIDDLDIYDHILGIQRIFQLNGMDVPSYDILERLKLILEKKTLWELVSPENDFVMF